MESEIYAAIEAANMEANRNEILAKALRQAVAALGVYAESPECKPYYAEKSLEVIQKILRTTES